MFADRNRHARPRQRPGSAGIATWNELVFGLARGTFEPARYNDWQVRRSGTGDGAGGEVPGRWSLPQPIRRLFERL